MSICAICGSKNVEIEIVSHNLPVQKADAITVINRVVHCHDCGMEIETTDNEDAIKALYHKAEHLSIERMLDDLQQLGYAQSAIEKAFGLPSRTLSKWKTQGSFSRAGLSLLRIAHTFPFVVFTAAHGYSDDAKLVSMTDYIKKYIHQWVLENNVTASSSFDISTQTMNFNLRMGGDGQLLAENTLRNQIEFR